MPTSIAFHRSHGVTALSGYSVFILPWAGHFSSVGAITRSQSSAALGGGEINSDGAQNNEIVWNIWLDAGTYKYAQLHRESTSHGIYSVQLDTVEKGTIDGYAGVEARNSYDEITGIAVTAGLKAFKLKMATKNGSSSGYHYALQSAAWIRTGA